MNSGCICPNCRIERALSRAMAGAGVDQDTVRTVADAVSEIAVERIAAGRFYSACMLFTIAVGLTYYAHRRVRPEPREERHRACETN